MSQQGPEVLLAIGGGISAYKSAILCSRLVQDGFSVRAAMTEAATRFVGPATLAALSGRPVATTVFEAAFPMGAHIELAQDLDLMIVAPATANLMAKFAGGIADDLVSTVYLQIECPVLLAPAMSASMWNKAAVQRNVDQLRADGCHWVGPDSGWLSCRQRGQGRMSDPEQIIKAVHSLIAS
ncbi:MAG: phosphopantothenoylcysteine decarboxylase [Pirellulales bacterium]|nr:phosphopantothenoylcysteine decarboxylase [Pirellulales bacterium]